jgi:hypothetical protein
MSLANSACKGWCCVVEAHKFIAFADVADSLDLVGW